MVCAHSVFSLFVSVPLIRTKYMRAGDYQLGPKLPTINLGKHESGELVKKKSPCDEGMADLWSDLADWCAQIGIGGPLLGMDRCSERVNGDILSNRLGRHVRQRNFACAACPGRERLPRCQGANGKNLILEPCNSKSETNQRRAKSPSFYEALVQHCMMPC